MATCDSIITIRPAPGCHTTVERARGMGLTILARPLFTVQPMEWQAPPAEDFNGLLIGSANALRHGGPALIRYLKLPVYAVGETTAAEARAEGFSVAAVGQGGLQGVLDVSVPSGLRLLRLAGEDHVPLTLPPSVSMETRILYASRPCAITDDLANELRQGALVLLHSAVAAGHFATECDRLRVARRSVRLVALGPRIAAAAGDGWLSIATAPHPREAALLALTKQLCQ